MKLQITRIAVYDENDERAATVERHDQGVAEITLTEKIHNVESWRELAAAVERAMTQLEAE